MFGIIHLAVIAAVLLFSHLSKAQFLPEDQIPIAVQNQLVANVIAGYGHLDMLALEQAFRDWLLMQPLPLADGQQLDAGTCSDCRPPTDGEEPIFPTVRDVQIITREGRIRSSFKVKWRKPVRLPRAIRDLYELNSYEVYLVRDDGTYEHRVITKTLLADGTEKLKRRIRFRHRDPGFYKVYVRPVYVQATPTETGSGDLAISSVTGNTGNTVIKGRSGGLKGGWGSGDGADLSPTSTIDDTFGPDGSLNGSNDALGECVYANAYIGTQLLQDIQGLDCSGITGVLSSVTEAEHFSGLRALIAPAHNITDISPLQGLQDLEHLNISGNPDVDLAALNQMDGLLYLFLEDLGISALPDLSASVDLVTYSLAGNTLGTGMHTCQATAGNTIAFFDISDNGLNDEDLSLASYYNITNLNISNNRLDAVQAPAGCEDALAGVSILDISDNFAAHSGTKVLADLSSLTLSALNLAGSNFDQLPVQLPTVCIDLNISGMSDLDIWQAAAVNQFPPEVPYLFSLQNSDELECASSNHFRQWFQTVSTGAINGQCPALELVEDRAFANDCESGTVAGLTVERDPINHAHYLQWDGLLLESQHRDFSYEIERRLAGTSVPEGQPYVIDSDIPSAVISNLDFDVAYEFRIRRCQDGVCSPVWSQWESGAYPLTRPVGVILTWTNPVTGDYRLRWSYPSNYYDNIDSRPHSFEVELNGQTLHSELVFNQPSFWQTNQNFTDAGVISIKACQGGVPGNPDVCGPPATITINAEPELDALINAPTSVVLSDPQASSDFTVTITANTVELASDEIDYFEIIETGANNSNNFSYYHDVSASRDQATHVVPVTRISNGSYAVNIRACRRNRLSTQDTCSDITPANSTVMIDVEPTEYASVNGSLCWDDNAANNGVVLSWNYNPPVIPGTEFLLPDRYRLSDELGLSSPLVFDYAALPGMFVDQTTSGNPLPAGSGWAIEACNANLSRCQLVGSIVGTDSSRQCVTPPQQPALRTGGPSSLNPGIWVDLENLPRQGFSFHWASDLRYENVHEDYGNTYDLTMYWQTYQYIDGTYTPIWLYAELRENPNNPNIFDGGLYLPGTDLSQAHDNEVGHFEVAFDDADTSTATITLNVQLPGGLLTSSGPQTFEITELSNETGVVPAIGTSNKTDFNNGVWQNTTGTNYKMISWQYNYFEGQVMLTFDTLGRAIWFNGTLDCRTETTSSCSGVGQNHHPDVEDATISYVTVEQGLPPFNPTADELDEVTSVNIGTLDRSLPADIFDPDSLTFNGSMSVSLFDINGVQFRGFNINTGSNGHLLSKQASYHDIRYRVGEEVSATDCSLASGACEVLLTWFSDDDFFDNGVPSVTPYYTLNGGTLQPLDADVCNNPLPDTAFVVVDFVCSITAPGDYRFYLRNRIGAAQQNTIAESFGTLAVAGSTNTSNPPLTTIFDSEDVFFPDRNGNSAFDPGFEANGETFIDLPLPDANSEAFGHTQGNFVVDSNGAANYTIPIMTAPGSGGLVPNVALSYNSQNGYGPMGRGWSVAGYSVISRCPQTFEQDGPISTPGNFEYVPGVSLSATDRFCLDGQRLMLVDEADVYGADGVLYRTELDSITVVKSVGAYGDGPQCFEVYRPDGSKEFFGDCRTDAEDDTALIRMNIDPVAEDAAYAWALASREDNSGNYIKFEYLQPAAASEQVAIYIDNIHYTGNRVSQAATYASIDFQYVAKTGGDVRPRILPYSDVVYQNGVIRNFNPVLTMVDDQRLSSVVTSVDGDQLRHYDLTYTAKADGRQYLTSLQECNGAVCYDPTSFSWSGQNNSIPALATQPSFELTDVIRDDGMDNNPLQATTADINSDGLQDLLIAYQRDNDNVEIRKQAISMGDGSFTVSDVTVGNSSPNLGIAAYDLNADGFTRPQDNEIFHALSATADLNGDGLIDKTGQNASTNSLEFEYNITGPGDTTPQFNAPVTVLGLIEYDIGGVGDPQGNPELDSIVSIVDVNQDGVPELLLRLQQDYCEGAACAGPPAPFAPGTPQPIRYAEQASAQRGGCQTACSSTSRAMAIGWLRTPAVGPEYYEIFELLSQPQDSAYYKDIDGNGYPELCSTDDPNGLRNGYQCVGAQLPTLDLATLLADDSSFEFQDFDNDGYLDLLSTDNDSSTGTWQVHYLSWQNGQVSFSVPQNTGLTAGRVHYVHQGNGEQSDIRVFMDYSGDGALDYVFIQYDQSDGFDVFASSGHNDLNQTQYEYLITDIYNGRGGSSSGADGEHWSIEYRPMTDPEVYTRDNNAINAWYGTGKTAVYDMITSMPLVGSVMHEMPAWDLVGDISSNLTYLGNWQDHTRYHYRGLKMQAGGRGVLGFREVDTFDVDRGLLTQDRYRQDFPYIGRSYASQTWLVSGADPWSVNEPVTNPNEPCWDSGETCLPVIPADNACMTDTGYQCSADTSVIVDGSHLLLGHSEMQYDQRQSISTNADITFAYTARELNQSFDLTGALLGRVVSVTEYNEPANAFYGNPTDNTVYAYQGLANGAAWLSRVDEDRSFDDSLSLIDLNNGQWITNRVASRSMQYQRPGVSSRSYFYNYAYDSQGRLTQEQKQDTPNFPQITLTTDYSNFDVFGNAREVSVSGTDISQNRVSKFVFDGKGRYLEQRQQRIDNNDVLMLQVVARNRYGEPLKTLGQQGENTYMAYDVMGKEYYSYTDTGLWQQTQFSRDTNCYSGSAYAVDVTGPGPDQTSCSDALGRTLLTETTSLDGQRSKVVNLYDIDGRVLAQSRPNFSIPANNVNGHWTKTIYDELDRPLQIRVPDGGLSGYSYPGLDVIYTNAEGYIRTDRNNILGERAGYTDYPVGGQAPDVSFGFDAKGNVIQITGPMGDSSSYAISMVYNKFDYLTQTNDPSKGGTWDYQVNALGEQTCTLDPSNQATKLSYDAFGRVIFRHFYSQAIAAGCSGNLAAMHEWSYENTAGFGSSGQLTQSVSTGQMVDYVFDDLGRVVTTSTDIGNEIFIQQHRYDLHSRSLYEYDASGRGISYGYNNHGYVTTTTDLGTLRTYQTIEQLNPWGNIAQSVYGSSQQMTRGYDDLGRVVSILTSEAGSNPIQDLTYSYDKLGNLKTRDDAGMAGMPFMEAFSYDGLNRLTDVQLTITGQAAVDTLDISYDLSGRITNKNGDTYSYAQGQVIHGMTSMSNGYTAIYDANGNQLQSGNRDSDYTVFNKPSRIENLQSVVEFNYGAGLNRFRRIDGLPDGTVQRETLYIGNVEIITDNPDSQNPATTYKRYIGDTIIVTESNTDHRVEYTHKDHLGSLHAITDVNGNLISQLSFSAFGERRDHLDLNIVLNNNPAENTTTRGYTGHEHIESLKLVHMNARTYDASVGQMMQADSIIPDVNNSQSLNRFAYVYNNPLGYTDPTGNSPRDGVVDQWARQRVIEKQARSGDRQAVWQLSQGNTRTMAIAGDRPEGTQAASFENNVSRLDSAEDEGNAEYEFGDFTDNFLSRQYLTEGESNFSSIDSDFDEPGFRTRATGFIASLIDDFGEHRHSIRSFACNDTIQSRCTEENLFDNGLLFANAPTSPLMIIFGTRVREEPLQNGEINFAWPVGWVQSFIDKENFLIRNVTTPDHTLHPGTVTRQIIREGNNLFIETKGHGFGVGPNINDFLASAIWQGVDQALINRANIYPRTQL